MPRQAPDSIQNDGRDWFWHPGANLTAMSASLIWERWLMVSHKTAQRSSEAQSLTLCAVARGAQGATPLRNRNRSVS